MADRSGPGSSGPPRQLSPNLAALLVLIVLAVAVLLWQRPWQTDPPGGSISAPPPVDAGAALTVQFSQLSAATTAEEFAQAAGSGPAAASFAEAAWQARAALGVDDARFRYVSGGDQVEFTNGDTQARVEISWADVDAADPSGSVEMRMRPRDDGTFDVVSAGLGSGALPVWLAGGVEIDRSGDLTVVRVSGGDADLDVNELAQQALREVETVVSQTASSLVVVSAPTPDVAAAMLGQSADAVGQIAAVSTSFDRRNGDLAGPVVVLNPGIFSTMDPRAAQVVMSHEAVHVLTGALGASADTWVIEGFADFVALRDDTAPLSVSAREILLKVRAGDVPDSLPTAAEFSASTYGLGAVYEGAWLAFRMLGEQYDDATILGFYRAVLDGTSVDVAGRDAFGLDTAQITAQWLDYLTNKASTVS